ncbi:uncharacterized protein [Diadema setosum]|uniref:uncharacterized protein n=1 Tax=Diadema setosum TaxID=31175 RepID=UPI003B3AA51E
MLLPKKTKSSTLVSLYVILGLTKKASEEEIHEAYQRLSKQYRQEANEGGTGCRRKIKEVDKAYRVLGDPALKRIYDEHGSVSWWVRFIDKFSPESIEKRGAFVRNLFTCCFGATCCCFCFCCCNCFHLGPHLNGVDDDEEDDELYVRENFSEFLPEEPDVCPNFMTKRRMKKEWRRAARQRRRCYYDHRAEMKKKKQARSGGSNDRKMKQGGHSESNKSVLSRTDSGCDVVPLDNAGFVLNEYDVSERGDLAEIVLEKREPDSGRSSIVISADVLTENFHGEKNSSVIRCWGSRNVRCSVDIRCRWRRESPVAEGTVCDFDRRRGDNNNGTIDANKSIHECLS